MFDRKGRLIKRIENNTRINVFKKKLLKYKNKEKESEENEIPKKQKDIAISFSESGKIDLESIGQINELLLSFEENHKDDTFKNGSLIIKDIFKDRLLNKRESGYEKFITRY